MKNILFIAPPAGGKGTISSKLVHDYGYIHISSGDLLRSVDKKSDLGLVIEEKISKGELVSDEIIFSLLEDKLRNLKGKAFILDGCVRNINQAKKLTEILKVIDINLDLVILLNVPYESLLKRVLGRQNCPNCKEVYNIYTKKPLNEGICDRCQNNLILRSDDNEETFKVRYQNYLNSSKDIIEYYQNAGILVSIDGENDPYKSLVSVIK